MRTYTPPLRVSYEQIRTARLIARRRATECRRARVILLTRGVYRILAYTKGMERSPAFVEVVEPQR